MLAAFGFIRFSCSLLVRCFLKSKKRRRGCQHLSDSEDDEPITKPKTTTAAKLAIARVIRIRPPKPMARPRLATLLSFLLKGKSFKSSPPIQKPPEPAVVVKDVDVRNRRVGNKMQMQDMTEAVPSVSCWHRCNADSDVVSIDGLSSNVFSHYASDNEASDEASDVDSIDCDSIDFDMDSDILPRTSSESYHHQGINPTFYGDYLSEEDDPMPWKQTQMRRLQSVVDRNLTLKNQSMSTNTSQLLTNPAYGFESKENSEESEDCQIETKLRSLKSVVKSGCLALPASTALVGSQYIGHTSLNMMYGDVTSDSEENYSDDLSNEEIDQTVIDQLTLDQKTTLSSRSMPMLSFRGLVDSDTSLNMGTLTWRNVAYSPRDGSEPEDGPSRTVADFQIRWKQNLTVENDNEIQSLEDQTKNEAGTSSEDKGITKVLVTPIRSISHDAFEDIDFKRTVQHVSRTPHIPHSQTKLSPVSPVRNSNFLITGLKHTRSAIRSLTLLLDRVDVFATEKKK